METELKQHMSNQKFDFEAWMQLYQTDPVAFEKKRTEVIEAEIAKAPARLQKRLRSLQWRVDAERRKYKNPLTSASRLYTMMWEKVVGEGGLMEALDGTIQVAEEKSQQSAKILKFGTSS